MHVMYTVANHASLVFRVITPGAGYAERLSTTRKTSTKRDVLTTGTTLSDALVQGKTPLALTAVSVMDPPVFARALRGTLVTPALFRQFLSNSYVENSSTFYLRVNVVHMVHNVEQVTATYNVH